MEYAKILLVVIHVYVHLDGKDNTVTKVSQLFSFVVVNEFYFSSQCNIISNIYVFLNSAT